MRNKNHAKGSGRRKLFTLAAVLLVIIALVVFCYRPVSVRITDRRHEEAIEGYVAAVEALDTAQVEDIKSRALSYNADCAEKRPYVSGEMPSESRDLYGTQLAVPGTDVIGYLEIPSIDVRLPIYRYSSEESLDKGCAHLEMSSLPVGGESSHSFLLAHRNMASAVMFEHLDRVKEGDNFFVTSLGVTATYTVSDISVIDARDPDAYSDLRIEKGKDYCTLVTCHPYGRTTHRLLVRGVRTK